MRAVHGDDRLGHHRHADDVGADALEETVLRGGLEIGARERDENAAF